jgi:DNA-binding CsgD family transcriptional regulator
MASEVDADLQTGNVERDPRGPLQPAVILSPREKQLLRRFAKGKTDAYIAEDIGGTELQIGEQRKRLLGKLHIRTQAELVAAANDLAPWPMRRR